MFSRPQKPLWVEEGERVEKKRRDKQKAKDKTEKLHWNAKEKPGKDFSWLVQKLREIFFVKFILSQNSKPVPAPPAQATFVPQTPDGFLTDIG